MKNKQDSVTQYMYQVACMGCGEHVIWRAPDRLKAVEILRSYGWEQFADEGWKCPQCRKR